MQGGLRVDDVIRQQNTERLIADDLFRHQDSVTKTERFGLTDIDDLCEL